MTVTTSTELTGNIVLSDHQYGKAENRVVRITRDTPRHEIRDMNVTTCLRGDFDDAYLTGDQAAVLPTDTQKNTAYSYAKEKGVASIEEYARALAQHFVDDIDPVRSARVEVEEYAWDRLLVHGAEHNHTWTRRGSETRTTAVTVDTDGTWVVSGFKDLVILKSTGSEFTGFLEDEYTTLQPTDDRIMATSLVMQWRYASTDVDWNTVYEAVKETATGVFAELHSRALQQTLFHMGQAVLERFPFIAEVRLSAPNKHHFDYDLDRFGIASRGEVFHADDRPYGLIQAAVERTDAPAAGPAWQQYSTWLS
ncbi:factor-independent urate hydroxylase [Rhodococcus sp. GA1]|uniref:factor-independent urate hydroxylase n=1 Tax=Rhodococcus sp. GA1 TaxID=2942275 RepID=UPI0020CC6D69|nr:urate oxidase [Rhodococcus sp. GA1]